MRACSLVPLWHLISPSLFAASAKLVVKNARLFTMAPAQRDPFIGYLVVGEDGTIVTVAAGDPPASLAGSPVFDAQGDWVIPGFVSAHSHLWQAAYRGLAGDKTLIAWIDDLYLKRASKASPEDMYWFCLLGSLDHLQHGITTAYDFNYSRPSWQTSEIDFDQSQFRAELKSGIRFVHGYEPEWVGKKSMAQGAPVDHASKRLKTMRAGLSAVRDKYEDATVLSPYEMLRLHTIGGADALGVKSKLGSLEPGKFADFVVVNPTRLGAVLEDPYANLVFVTGERDVDQVFVGGEVKVDHGRMLDHDMAAIEKEVHTRVSREQ